MYFRKTIVLCFGTLLMFLSCSKEKPNITGMWTIERVTVGVEEMTPLGRWMNLKENGTHQGGNGRYLHSVWR